MNPKTWIEVSESALRHNAQAFLDLAGKAKVMAVVKSNAYGHGLVESSRILSRAGVHWFAVDHIDEALTLRKFGIRKPILVLGYTPNHCLVDAVKNNISLVAYNTETIKALGVGAYGNTPAKIHLPIETGLTRDGIRLEDLSKMIKLIGKYPNIEIEGTFLHFANIEDTKSRAYADHQLNEFKKAIVIFKEHKIDPKFKHTASSAASILYSDTHFNLLRVGIAMYGLWPSEETRRRARRLSLRLVLSWKTIVAQVKQVKKGTPISYGLTERMPSNGAIAVLPIGYADGFDRVGMSRKGQVLICGKRCKVMGRVCMNMTMVDVTGLKNIGPESEVTLIGTQGKALISAEEMADLADTINYEIVARLNQEIPRIVVK